MFMPHVQIHSSHVQDNSLETCIQRSHMIYDNFLTQQQELLKKFGFNPKEIALYIVLSFPSQQVSD